MHEYSVWRESVSMCIYICILNMYFVYVCSFLEYSATFENFTSASGPHKAWERPVLWEKTGEDQQEVLNLSLPVGILAPKKPVAVTRAQASARLNIQRPVEAHADHCRPNGRTTPSALRPHRGSLPLAVLFQRPRR